MILRQSLIMGLGTGINAILGLLFYIIVGRTLSVSDFGYFSFLLVVGVMGAELSDLGVNSAIVKFAHAEQFEPVFSLAFFQKLAMGFLLFAVAIVAQIFYPANFLLSAIIAWFVLLFALVTQSFIAKQQYFFYVSANVLCNLLRLGIIFFLLKLGVLSVETALGSFAFAYLVMILLGLMVVVVLNKRLPLVTGSLTKTAKMIFPYSGWVGLSLAVSSVAAKADGIAVFTLAGSAAAGIYSSAQRLAQFFPQVSTTLEGVFSPKFSASDLWKKDFKKYLVLSSLAAMSLILFIPFSGLVVTLVFGAKYFAAVGIFQLYVFGMAIFLLTGPFSAAVLYRFGKSRWHFVSSLSQALISILLYLFFIPRIGITGAVISLIIVQFANLCYYLILFLRLDRTND